MIDNFVIEVDNLWKRFFIGETKRMTLFSTIRYKLSGEVPKREYWALKGINFKVKKGEMVAIIGPNGAGKTTLLRILSGIMEPTFGVYSVTGEVSPILELGLGFDPNFTALENIYLYGALHGYPRKKINKCLDRIIDFSELGEFINTKLRDFSSGMRQRLAFATIIETAGDIIMVDEVLSVGDTSFQRKCIKKFEELLNRGKTILFVSHGIGEERKMCKRALYINKGEQKGFGALEEMENLYRKDIGENLRKNENRKN